MAAYWLRVCGIAVGSSFDSIGQTPGSLLFLVVSLAIGTWVVWRRKGWAAMRAHLWENAGKVVLLSACAWLPFFVWHVGRAAYQFHETQANELDNKTITIARLETEVRQQQEILGETARLRVENARLRAAVSRLAIKPVAPEEVGYDKTIRPDQRWSTEWRDLNSSFVVRVELRPENPVSTRLRLYVRMTNSANTADDPGGGWTGQFRPVTIEALRLTTPWF